MKNLWKRYMAWRNRHVKNYIGKIVFKVKFKDSGTVGFPLLFFMSPSGQRSLEWPADLPRRYNWEVWYAVQPFAIAAREWEKGGDLPEQFVPVENDGFEQLLMRIVERKMGVHEDD
jgi:hypothetical protein